MKKLIGTTIIALAAVLTGCNHPQEQEKLRSFAQWEEADLVITEFHSFDDFSIYKPKQTESRNGQVISNVEFDDLLPSLNINRDLVVVVCSKRPQGYSHAFLDEIQNWLQVHGFKRVIIQQRTSSLGPYGFPILRDTGASNQA